MRAIRPCVSEDGVTLVELLITLMIISIAFLAILGGMTTAILASDLHRKQSTGESTMRDFAEAIKGQTYIVGACVTSYDGSYMPLDASYGVSVTNVHHWVTSTASFVPAPANPPCTAPDSGVQKITLEVSLPGATGGTEHLDVTKRK